MTKPLQLWRYNPVTGIWLPARTVTSETANQWLEIFQKDEPGVQFKVSVNKPRS